MVPVVVFHHGLFGHGELRIGNIVRSYFNGIDRAVAGLGYPTIVSGVHPTASVTSRARQLKETILSRTRDMDRADEKVVIIAHSMGGLDARHMISRLGMADRVSHLVTVCTPHRGTPFADWAVARVKRTVAFSLLANLGLDTQGCFDVTCESCTRFNTVTPDMAGVQYFSVSAARPWHGIAPFALPAYKIIFDAEGANDGLVSVQSATWGTHLGTWPADHWQTINRKFSPAFLNGTGDITPYYLKLLDQIGLVHSNEAIAC